MNNVLIVKTAKSNGRAWCAWKITEERAKNLAYLISVNGEELATYLVNDYKMSEGRAFFDLTNISDTELAKQIIDKQSKLFQRGWTLKFGSY